MTRPGSVHPLDVDLADLIDGPVDEPLAGELAAHLAGCLLCRVKLLRLSTAPPPGPGGGALPSPAFPVPEIDRTAEPAAGELWLAGDDERTLVLVVGTAGDRVSVVPVTLDYEAADDTTVVVDADRSPFRTPLALHPALAAEVPRAILAGRAAALVSPADVAGLLARAGAGPAVTGDDDPRLEVRQHLADRLAALAPTRPDLVADLRDLRGDACRVGPLGSWGDLDVAAGLGWAPVATVDEIGVVLVVFDTPHGLVDDRDFDAARSVLTRLNATALVVLAQELSETAEVFDSAALHAGIDMPSGAHTPPRPLIGGLVAFDAISKFLDQHSGARAMSPPTRGPVGRVDVADVLRQAAAAAVADTVRQGGRFKIAPKRRGYESLAAAPAGLGDALATAFTGGSVVEALQALATEDGG
jgi:hypothetical protein